MSNIFGYIKESINEGDGLRSVIFISGCHGMCEGCQNPESWDSNYGVPFDNHIQDKIIDNILKNKLIDGITFCGGEPFLSSLELIEFIKKVKKVKPNINFWSYTGFAWEYIQTQENMVGLLKYLDVIIDGAFVESKKDLTLRFRGSTNQRIINVQESLLNNKIILKNY